MANIRKYDGKILARDGKLAAGEACCCGKLPNCCESQGVLLQVTLVVTGLADGHWTGCDCLNGTYVADVVELLTWPNPDLLATGYGDSVLPQPNCVAVDQNGTEYSGHVFIEFACDGSYAMGDWGFLGQPWNDGDYPATDLMRVEFGPGGPGYGGPGQAGVACVGGSASGDFANGTLLVNTFWTGCDYTNLAASIVVQ